MFVAKSAPSIPPSEDVKYRAPKALPRLRGRRRVRSCKLVPSAGGLLAPAALCSSLLPDAPSLQRNLQLPSPCTHPPECAEVVSNQRLRVGQQQAQPHPVEGPERHALGVPRGRAGRQGREQAAGGCVASRHGRRRYGRSPPHPGLRVLAAAQSRPPQQPSLAVATECVNAKPMAMAPQTKHPAAMTWALWAREQGAPWACWALALACQAHARGSPPCLSLQHLLR